MNRPKILINASNLHVGGGVQVAASFIDEMATLVTDDRVVHRFPWLEGCLTLEVSDEVAANLSDASSPLHVIRKNRLGLRAALPGGLTREFDVCFTVFGPDYSPPRARRNIVGFADTTSLWDVPLLQEDRSTLQKLRREIRRRVSRGLFHRADHLIVEADHVATDLIRFWRFSSSTISVVPNSLNSVFRNPKLWRSSGLPSSDRPLVSYATKAYRHKNLDLLPLVATELLLRHGVDARFVLTLSPDEWHAQPESLKACAINVGTLTVDQLPDFYGRCAASIFPSLFECFSITPLEALICRTPLAASNRPFVRNIVGDNALFFDPNDAADAASAVAEAIRSGGLSHRVVEGAAWAENWPKARDRAEKYLEIIDAELRFLDAPDDGSSTAGAFRHAS